MKRGPSPAMQYYGWFCGLVPVYVANPYHGTPSIEPRWWCPARVLAAAQGALRFGCQLLQVEEPDVPVLISGRIHRSRA